MPILYFNQYFYFLLIALNIQSKIQAPTIDTKALWRFKPVTFWAPKKLKTTPPIKAPIIPVTILAIAPIDAFLPIIILAIHPEKAPSINQAIIPIF